MNMYRRACWWKRISKFEVILSMACAVIQIGLFSSYILSVFNLLIVGPAAIGVPVSFLLADYLRKRRMLADHLAEQTLEEQVPAVAAFVKARRSIPEQFKKDIQIRYEEVTHTFRISERDGHYTRHTIGDNASGKDFEKTFYTVVGETSIANGSVHATVVRRIGNETERLEPTIVWSSQNVKVIGVDFNPPVGSRSGRLDLTFSSEWPGAFVSKNGYLFAAIPQCFKGVRKLTIRAVFDDPISQCSIWTWDLKRNELKEFERVPRPSRRGGTYTIEWQRTDPDINKIFILRYKRNGTNSV